VQVASSPVGYISLLTVIERCNRTDDIIAVFSSASGIDFHFDYAQLPIDQFNRTTYNATF
jgi:hypothetical protein